MVRPAEPLPPPSLVAIFIRVSEREREGSRSSELTQSIRELLGYAQLITMHFYKCTICPRGLLNAQCAVSVACASSLCIRPYEEHSVPLQKLRL